MAVPTITKRKPGSVMHELLAFIGNGQVKWSDIAPLNKPSWTTPVFERYVYEALHDGLARYVSQEERTIELTEYGKSVLKALDDYAEEYEYRCKYKEFKTVFTLIRTLNKLITMNDRERLATFRVKHFGSVLARVAYCLGWKFDSEEYARDRAKAQKQLQAFLNKLTLKQMLDDIEKTECEGNVKYWIDAYNYLTEDGFTFNSNEELKKVLLLKKMSSS